MIKKVLITGINGFAGSHLADLLVGMDVQVHGTVRRHASGIDTRNIDHLLEERWIELHECDLQSFSSVEEIISKVRPDAIFHLAATSYVPASWEDPSGVMHNNIDSTLNVLKAVKNLRNNEFDPIIQLACSSEEYGLVHATEVPIKETNPLRPLSPYAVSKVTGEMLGWQYSQSYGLRTIITRAFNHEGARRGSDFVISNFAKQIVEMEQRGQRKGVLRVGNLEAMRDFTHVSDVVKAYWQLARGLMMNQIQKGETFNIARGEAVTMQEVVDGLIELSKVDVTVEQDPDRMRPSDVPILLGDATKIRRAIKWKPTKSFKEILVDTLEYWRQNI